MGLTMAYTIVVEKHGGQLPSTRKQERERRSLSGCLFLHERQPRKIPNTTEIFHSAVNCAIIFCDIPVECFQYFG